MLRWFLIVVLTVGFSTAWAQSGPSAVTARAQGSVADLERRVQTQAQVRNALAQKFDEQNAAIQQLKREKTSWRRDRELRELQSEAHATGQQATAAARQLEALQGELLVARRSLVKAIDAELATNTAAPQRTKDLTRQRTTLAPYIGDKVHRIRLPEIDESADPEELREQAANALKIEQELEGQLAGLDAQVRKLESKSTLLGAHDRTQQMDRREDNTPGKGAPQSGGREAVAADARPPGAVDMFGMFDAIATAGALGEVVDSNTLEVFQRNYRGSDPKSQLESVKKVRAQVEAKRAKLRADRQRIERAAKSRQ